MTLTCSKYTFILMNETWIPDLFISNPFARLSVDLLWCSLQYSQYDDWTHCRKSCTAWSVYVVPHRSSSSAALVWTQRCLSAHSCFSHVLCCRLFSPSTRIFRIFTVTVVHLCCKPSHHFVAAWGLQGSNLNMYVVIKSLIQNYNFKTKRCLSHEQDLLVDNTNHSEISCE